MINTYRNHAEVIGRLHGDLTAATNKNGDVFFDGTFAVQRQSGTVDHLPISVPAALVGSITKATELYGRHLRLVGDLRSYNKVVDGKSHHIVLYVKEITAESSATDDNQIELQGVISRAPIYRKTPLGREICDFMVAINRSGGRSAYIPVICWGKTARMVSTLALGTPVAIRGRFQSREYAKKLDIGETVTMTAYEVSSKSVKVVEAWATGSV